MNKPIIVSGMRPTGRLHIGHFVGALENWVSLQKDHQTFFFSADLHALTTNADSSTIESNTIEMVKDWVAAGIDPKTSVIFRQSKIKQHAELFLIYSMLITTARLERNPTLKDQVRDLNMESVVFGHLGYPVLQAADILLYKGSFVPVGEDQISNLEITRELARRFNQQYGQVFPEPEPKLTKISRLVGLDGKAKMSKSLGNTIMLSDSPDGIFSAVKKAVTDTEKVRKNDPGRPEVCTVFSYHKKFNTSKLDAVEADCRSGALGCMDCKKMCSEAIATEFASLREKRAELDQHPTMILDILADGEKKAQEIAHKTMAEVHSVMKLG